MVRRQFDHSFTSSTETNPFCFFRAIIKLGCEGTITGFDIDTTNFRDSSPVQVKVEAAVASEDLKDDDLDNWKVRLETRSGWQTWEKENC